MAFDGSRGRRNNRVPHIACVMRPESQQPSKPPRLAPAGRMPSHLDSRPLPQIPPAVSRYSNWRQQRRAARPGCTHLTTTRLYGGNYVCELCRHPGSFGWLYRCTQDRDVLIQAGKDDGGSRMTFDKLGDRLLALVKPGSTGAEARSDKLSFLKELTSEQMATYTPAQLVTVLKQREKVLDAIKEAGLKAPLGGKKPWVPREQEECQHKVCHYCRPHHADRAFLSLNAIANGEVPPAAAVGFGFNYIGQRPVANANIVKNLGCRPVPLPRPRSPSPRSPTALSASWSLSDILEEHQEVAATTPDSQMTPVANFITNPTDAIQDRRSAPGSTEELQSLTAEDRLVRPAWTPPPTPVLTGQDKDLDDLESELELSHPPFNGRSPSSLKTNAQVYRDILASLGTNLQPLHDSSPIQTSAGQCVPYLTEEDNEYEYEYDGHRSLPVDSDLSKSAYATVLPAPTVEEELFFAGGKTAMEEAEEENGVFGAEPLVVSHGVAVLEESVELGEPDVVTED